MSRVVKSGLFLWIALSLMAQTQYIPHVTRAGGGFETSFWLINTIQVEASCEMKAYSASGALLTTVSRTIAGRSTQKLSATELFGAEDVAWVEVNSASVRVTAVYQAVGDNKVPAHVSQTDELAVRWRIYTGNPDKAWDGVVLVNPTDLPNSFIYNGYAEDGSSLGSISPFAPLMAKSKDLHVITDSFPNAAYFEIETQFPTAVTALRGDLDSSDRLWVNPAVAIEKEGEDVAFYEVRFDAIWSQTTHPEAYEGVSNPHFSPISGATHNSNYQMWQPGALASEGMVQLAETGVLSLLNQDQELALETGHVGSVIAVERNLGSPGSVTFVFQAKPDKPLLSLATMVAPSPDWFVGVHNLKLRNENGWISSMDIELEPYDAGTRSSNTFSLFGPRTQPAAVIRAKQGAPLGGSVLAKMSIRRMETGLGEQR